MSYWPVRFREGLRVRFTRYGGHPEVVHKGTVIRWFGGPLGVFDVQCDVEGRMTLDCYDTVEIIQKGEEDGKTTVQTQEPGVRRWEEAEVDLSDILSRTRRSRG